MADERNSNKVYSPDIKAYSFEGRSGVFGTLVSLVVGPIRLMTRVMHNIFILPATLLESYASALLTVSVALLLIGVLDFALFNKWPLLVSQIPAIYFATVLKKQSRKSTQIALEKREVDIDTEKVEELCNTVFNELQDVIKE